MKVLMLARELLKQEHINSYLKEFKRSERSSLDEVKKNQSNRLIDLIEYLVKYNSFYSTYMSRHFNLAEINSGTVYSKLFKNLPLVDKQFIRDHAQDWVTTNKHQKLTRSTTSGSTGVPFEIFHSNISRDVKLAAKFRLLEWNGVKRSQKQIYYGCTFSSERSKLATLKIYLNDRFVYNKIVIDVTKVSEKTIPLEIQRINVEQPVTIWGYPSVIFEIARYSLVNNLKIRNNRLKMVIFSGESHTPYMEKIVAQAFHVWPSDEYNSNEGFIAGTCEHHKMHLNEDILIAEVLTDTGEVKDIGKGELIVTHLFSFDYPFIRYNTGDIVEIIDESCPCGRNFKIIKSLEGRTGSVIHNGEEKISNSVCNHYVTKSAYFSAIKKYQIIQRDTSTVVIKIVAYDKAYDFQQFEKHMQRLFNMLKVNFEYVDDIPRDRSGKYRDVINCSQN